MAMGVVSPEDFEKELNSFSKSKQPLPKAEVIDIPTSGRNGAREVPASLRKVISEEAINGTPAKELAKEFQVSESSISAYKNGATSTSTYNNPDPSLNSFNNKVRNKIVIRSRKKLMMALEHITEDKLKDAKVETLANVAKQMSGIIKDMEPEQDEGKNKPVPPQFFVFAPQFKQESAFEVINVPK